jgi:hypothetical protein
MDDKKIIWEYLFELSKGSNEEGCIKIVTKKNNLLSVFVSISKNHLIYFNIKNKNGEVYIYDTSLIVPYEDDSTPDELNAYLIKRLKPIIRDNKIKRLDI